MFAVRCPRCGRPGATGLADPERFRCPACAYDGAPPADVRQRLLEARAAVASLSERERQLSTFQRRVLTSAAFRVALYLGAFGVVLTPFCCCFGLFSLGGAAQSAPMMVVITVPLFVVGLFGLSGLVFLRGRLARVRAHLAAFPPPAPGEPAGCHVCGGPVAPRGTAPFVRCGWCGADNLLDPRLVEARGRERVASLDDLQNEVQRRQRGAADALRGATRGLFVGALLSLPASFCPAVGLVLVLQQTETELHEDLRYTLVAGPPGRCVAMLSPEWTSEETVELDAEGWVGDGELTEVRPADGVPTFGARALVGAEVIATQAMEPRPMHVTGVYGTLGMPSNRAHLRGADGQEDHAALETLCLTDETASPVPPVPLTLPAP